MQRKSLIRYAALAAFAAWAVGVLVAYAAPSSQQPANPPPATVSVPNVVGMTLAAGQAALAKEHLVGVSKGTAATADKKLVGVICYQSPIPGRKAAQGTEVNLRVGAPATSKTKGEGGGVPGPSRP